MLNTILHKILPKILTRILLEFCYNLTNSMNFDEALCATARAMRVIYPCLDSPPHPSEASRGQSWLRSL